MVTRSFLQAAVAAAFWQRPLLFFFEQNLVTALSAFEMSMFSTARKRYLLRKAFPFLVIEQWRPSFLPDCSMVGSSPAYATMPLRHLNLDGPPISAQSKAARTSPTPSMEAIWAKWGRSFASETVGHFAKRLDVMHNVFQRGQKGIDLAIILAASAQGVPGVGDELGRDGFLRRGSRFQIRLLHRTDQPLLARFGEIGRMLVFRHREHRVPCVWIACFVE